MLLTKYYTGDKIKNNEIGEACSTSSRRGVHTGFRWGDLRRRHNLEDVGANGNLISMWIFKK
jgi:hypothetical protein